MRVRVIISEKERDKEGKEIERQRERQSLH